jgi:hypothetical protein
VRQLTLVAPDGEDDLEDEEWYEIPRPSPTFRPRSDIANSKPRSRQPRQTTRAWKETLSRLRSTTEQTPAIRSAALPPGHELVYVVDIQASLAGNGLVLEVATRNRKRDGEWSKPKGRRFALNKDPRPEAVVLGRPPRGGRLHAVAPSGGGTSGRPRRGLNG